VIGRRIIAGGVWAAPFLLLSAVFASGDSDFDILDIGGSELRFLSAAPAKPPHFHQSRVVISADSLRTGWVHTKQCHYHLDQVNALQVVFRPGRVRNLRILQADNVGKAWVEGASVQLENVGADAVLCIANEHLALTRSPDGSIEWRGGPYMRRFLDGYFPMQVQLVLDYPDSLLRMQSIEPVALKFHMLDNPGQIRLDALFEGRLDVEVRFIAAESARGLGW
jgi:hypothetical protein